MAELLAVDPEAWRAEVPQIEEPLRRSSASACPTALREQLEALEKRLAAG